LRYSYLLIAYSRAKSGKKKSMQGRNLGGGGTIWLIAICVVTYLLLHLEHGRHQHPSKSQRLIGFISGRNKKNQRRIRNIRFNYDDCAALFQHELKMQGPVINALGALWQQTAKESSDGADRCVFLTWLSHFGRVTCSHLVGM
jgi:hypothetical protein